MNDAFDNAQTDREALARFATRLTSVPCATCTLPEDLRQIIETDRASASPHSFDQLSRFLATLGIELTGGAISAHFRKGHAQ
jgi:hypothetical protein